MEIYNTKANQAEAQKHQYIIRSIISNIIGSNHGHEKKNKTQAIAFDNVKNKVLNKGN